MASLRAAPAWIDLESELETDNETEGSTYNLSGHSGGDFLSFSANSREEEVSNEESPLHAAAAEEKGKSKRKGKQKNKNKSGRLSSSESERSGASPRLGSTSPFTGVTRSHSYQRIPNNGVEEVDYSAVVLKGRDAAQWTEGDSLGGGGQGPIDRSQNYYVDKKGRIKPLRWPYMPFVLLLTFCYTQDDIEVFLMYFLFAGTSYGCDFQEAFGIYLQINAIVQIFAQPVLAWVTDRYGRISTILLWVALLFEGLIELTMVSVPGTSFGVMLTLCLIRAVAHIQNTDSIWKVFKQKLQFSLGDAAFSEQEDIINSIGMWGIVGEVVLDVYIFGAGFLLAGPGGFSYGVVSGWIYGCTVATSLLSWFVAYFWFRPSYVLEQLHSSAATTASMPAYASYEAVQDVEEPPQPSAVQKLMKSRACHWDTVDFQESRNDENSFPTGLKGLYLYFKDAVVYMCTDPIIGGGLLHSLLVCLMWKLMANAEPVQLAQSNSDTSVVQSLDNLCGGTFTDLFYQYSWNNIFYVIGALLYILVLNRTKPYMYYMVVYPVAAVFFALCMIPLATGARYYFAVLMASVVGVFPWFLYRYDVYLVTAATDTKYLGILNAVIGYIRYITPAIPGLILAFDLTNLTILLAYVSLALSVLFCVAYVLKFRKLLQKISSPTYRKSSEPDENDTVI